MHQIWNVFSLWHKNIVLAFGPHPFLWNTSTVLGLLFRNHLQPLISPSLFYQEGVSFSNQAFGDWFSLYKHLLSLHTWLFLFPSKQWGWSMCTSFDRSPFRKMYFTSSCCEGQSKFVAWEINTLIIFNLAIGAKFSS